MEISRRAMLAVLGSTAALPLTRVVAFAQDAEKILKIGYSAAVTTTDPHNANSGSNNAVLMHIYDSLVYRSPVLENQPGLAKSWRVIDDTHWEFTLRDGVTYHDGTPLSWEDIKVSIDRVNRLETVSSYKRYTRTVKGVLKGDRPNTLIIETNGPDPLLLNSLSRIFIISAKHKDATVADYMNGSACIGTGPYKLDKYVSGGHCALTRFASYWGDKQDWATVDLRFISDNGARLAGLLSGDLDLIDNLPAEAIERVKRTDGLHVISGVSSRFVGMGFDFGNDISPDVTDNDGNPLKENPFRKLKVRQAFDCAIDRKAIVERVMQGEAELAAQFMPKGGAGTSPDINPTPYDPEKAKQLLAEAGYPDGFKLAISGPNDRYINDEKIIQAIAQMLTRVGVTSTVNVMPWSVYTSKVNNDKFSFFMDSYGVNTGETSNPLTATLATYDPDTGLGSVNFGRYSNPELDKILKKALSDMDEAKRNALLADASKIAFTEMPLLPLHFQTVVLAAKKSITYTTRRDQYTTAMMASSAS
jgi:peptide/nickel transport system substrate-binding protein